MAMNHKVSLSLELLEQRPRGLRFRLAVQNQSAVPLLFMRPEIHGLRFVSATTGAESEWYTSVLVSSVGGTFVLGIGETRPFTWLVRPCAVERPETDDHFADDWYDFDRWCVDLAAGEYRVSFRWRVDADFFDPDTHAQLPDLEREAAQAGATVWLGEAFSDQLAVSWRDPGRAAHRMTDAKWRDLFAALRKADSGPLRWKFVRDGRIYVEPAPPAGAALERALGDVLPYPYAPYREIEWVEVPAARAGAVAGPLTAIDGLPILQLNSGLRVLGNTW